MRTCRSCASNKVKSVFSLGQQPLANELLNHPSDPYEKFPLDLVACTECSLVQLAETVPPNRLFSQYAYLTSCSPPNVARAKELAHSVMKGWPCRMVVELGSNDGYLLQHYLDAGVQVLGIDPSRVAARLAALKGIPIITEFFDSALASQIGPIADILHANNVLAHVPDINDFVAGIKTVLKPDGVAIIEVPYVYDLLRKNEFDTIYAEHVFYFSVQALTALFSRHGMQILKVERIPYHGGSLRFFASRGAPAPVNFDEYPLDFERFTQCVTRGTRQLITALRDLKTMGKSVAGFGAAAKATTFLNYCGIGCELLPYVADDTPTKQGKYIPGTGIEIVSTAEWLERKPEYTLILCWNFAQEIVRNYPYGGQWFTWNDLPTSF